MSSALLSGLGPKVAGVPLQLPSCRVSVPAPASVVELPSEAALATWIAHRCHRTLAPLFARLHRVSGGAVSVAAMWHTVGTAIVVAATQVPQLAGSSEVVGMRRGQAVLDALVGFGLGGPEIGVPRAQFRPHFDAARAAGLHSVPHAGETTGPETVWDALRLLGAERIGHGTSCHQDPVLLEHLALKGIVLEVCPTSNVRTRQVASIEAHPVRQMLDAGVVVTLNTDDPPFFHTTLGTEYDKAGLGEAELRGITRTAIEASFADEATKQRLLREIGP